MTEQVAKLADLLEDHDEDVVQPFLNSFFTAINANPSVAVLAQELHALEAKILEAASDAAAAVKAAAAADTSKHELNQ